MAKRAGSPATESESKELTTIDFFGAPPLIGAENESAYGELLGRISGAVNPKDIFEEIWVRDVVDLTWEILRWRRLKAQLIGANMHEGVKRVLGNLYNLVEVEFLAESWKTGDAAAIEKVDKQLAASGLTNDAIVAETLSYKLQEIERIDRMAMTAEARRNGALREIERHRENFAQKLRKATQVEDAEYSVVPDHEAIDNNAAA